MDATLTGIGDGFDARSGAFMEYGASPFEATMDTLLSGVGEAFLEDGYNLVAGEFADGTKFGATDYADAVCSVGGDAAGNLAGGLVVKLGGKVANKVRKGRSLCGLPKEGIYEFAGKSGMPYVGQSKNIPRRLQTHTRKGKLPEGGEVKTTGVDGGKTAREVAEQRRINELGGVDNCENLVNPIGPNRKHLLDEY